ncbi:uncharacterized protein LOC110225900 [Arabidopsis lyrata subsp. lyrata]|uniref:uncharacterized protein LOC110225900 n=1 Tax=Arabidopsis lyrata subsp. lyrata TaxID=81972 RepID=UPI000A29D731|nr:uncharacterized protein LOC110225900 [Arabidopsis lyrata subsp. lyrata]|eukprot:XP_020871888.1 uncharacterized protein LOC110225900 [Arabidopsis lyrata subsp. lyrata]
MDLDKAIQDMSISDDKPLVLSNLPKYCSSERNSCSIMGRFLNPEAQRMSNWILDMPRIWRLYNRVRGVALSKDRFQFIFKSEEDLDGILKIGVWTQDDWCVVMEKWLENPPPDYLMFLPIWVRLRNLPVNYYTKDTIEDIAACVGKVLQVGLDLEKSQVQDYVRVQVLLNVSNPLRNSKEVQLPTGEIVIISFDYERVRKRCFNCQRLSHDKTRCPFKLSTSPKVSSVVSEEKLKEKEVINKDFHMQLSTPSPIKFMADAMKKYGDSKVISNSLEENFEEDLSDLELFVGFKTGSCEASSSANGNKKDAANKVKTSWQRNSKSAKELLMKEKVSNFDSKEKFDRVFKRKAQFPDTEVSKVIKRDNKTVVPQELPQFQ